MKNYFLKIFSHFNYILSQQEVSDPIVTIHPYIKYSILNESADDQLKDNAEAPSIQKDKGMVAHFELKFVVNYRDYFKYNTLDKKSVFLKKYKRKQSPTEKYVEDIHEPETIFLTPGGLKNLGYTLDICPKKIPTSDDGENESNEEMFILHTTKNVLSPNSDRPFADINNEFFEYMIGEWERRNDFGFRFVLELTSSSNGALSTTNKKLIETELFAFNISKKGDCIEILPENANCFHLYPDSRVVKQTKLSKLVAPIRKFFRRGTNN